MHRIFQLPFLFGILFFACKPSRMHPSGPYTGKVVGDICSQYTIQLLSGNMDPARYVKNWKNPSTDSIYHNVFSLKNYCDFNRLGLHRGDTFQFSLIPDSTVQNCAVCLIYAPTPPISNSIKVTR
ncbi:MAG: hypothetical protein BGO55_07455 [Sphingobacteriales bacterium 50-39]|nr:hypothetical protein [Sphingobacteriales bacterium]OJW53081.1 MAG: hypothetical protein BGO55_07455 [Sphingobacteriales bacterium 50-39]